MTEKQMRLVRCPACGEDLNIPAHLETFSCLYCGHRIEKETLPPPISAPEGEQAKVYYETHVLQVIANHISIDRLVTGSEYENAFHRYKADNEEIFCQLDTAVKAGCTDPKQAACFFLDELERYWAKDTTRKPRAAADTDKFVIAVFLVPMIRSLQLSVSEDYCRALQEQWCLRHPKSPFYLGTYEDLSKGFQKKILGLCFITTAVCEFEGKPDNCEELTAFRAFRDGYLRSCPDGEALIEKYYDIAPGIVLHIDLAHDREKIYRSLKRTYLQPCYEDILAGRLQQCKARYTQMVLQLERKYLS